MNAVICETYGGPENLVYKEVEDPEINDYQVLVNVKACSVNFPDTLIIRGLYQVKPKPPFSPGSDISGVVEKVGSKIKHVKPGDEIFGIVSYGGFAEKVVVDGPLCIPKPPGMSFVNAASFLFTYGTSYYGLEYVGKLKADETLLVLGASGGVGLTAVELGKLLGAKVIAAASTDEKLELCKEYGADATINYTTTDLKEAILETTDGKGVDVIYDPVGGSFAETTIRRLSWGGRYLVIGFASGEIPRIPLNLPLLKGCEIRGVFFGGYLQKFPSKSQKMMLQIIQWFTEGKLKPYIQQTFDLKNAADALQMMEDRKVKGKIVITM